MKAEITNIYSKNRIALHEVVPVDTPFSISVEATSFCNMKCKYCLHSFPKEKIIESGHVFETMSDDTFTLFLNQLGEFPRPIKSINFCGVGEPLLHRKLPYMIKRLKELKLADKVFIITNGIALNHHLSEALVDSGLDMIKISLNGLTQEAYRDNCNVKIDFDKFYSEISYLNSIKGNMEIGVKILDSCLDSADEKEFYRMFEDCCDKMNIEKTVSLFDEVSYDGIIKEETYSRYDLNLKNRVRVCANPFIRMGVRSTGKVMIGLPYNGITTKNMDIRKESIYNIWNGVEHKHILLNVLSGVKEGITEKCKKCVIKDDFAFPEDNLDDHALEIYERVMNSMN